MPVVDGYSFPHLTKRLNLAGRSITGFLVELLQRKGYTLSRSADFEALRTVKEKSCYVSQDYHRELQVMALSFLTIVYHCGGCTKY